MKTKYVKSLRICFLVLILATLLFIFINSALPPETSSEQSGKVEDIITSIIPADTTLGEFLVKYLRKIAHFTEYGLLGIEFALMIMLLSVKRGKCALLSLTVPFFVGFIDESIQILSKRGPSISDVWIDVGGFIFFGLIAYGVCFAVFFTVGKIKSKKGN